MFLLLYFFQIHGHHNLFLTEFLHAKPMRFWTSHIAKPLLWEWGNSQVSLCWRALKSVLSNQGRNYSNLDTLKDFSFFMPPPGLKLIWNISLVQVIWVGSSAPLILRGALLSAFGHFSSRTQTTTCSVFYLYLMGSLEKISFFCISSRGLNYTSIPFLRGTRTVLLLLLKKCFFWPIFAQLIYFI